MRRDAVYTGWEGGVLGAQGLCPYMLGRVLGSCPVLQTHWEAQHQVKAALIGVSLSLLGHHRDGESPSAGLGVGITLETSLMPVGHSMEEQRAPTGIPSPGATVPWDGKQDGDVLPSALLHPRDSSTRQGRPFVPHILYSCKQHKSAWLLFP